MLDDLEKQLYSRKGVERKEEKEIKQPPVQPADSYQTVWTDRGNKLVAGNLTRLISKIGRFGKIAFWAAAATMIILIGVVGFYFYEYFSSDREIIFDVSGPKTAMAGVPFDIAVNFSNGSKDALEGVSLSIFLPENAIVLGEKSDKRVILRTIGMIGSNESFQEKIPAVVFGEGQTAKNFNISVSYASILKSRFEKTKIFEITVKEPGIKLDLTAPEKVLNNEEFEISAHYSNVSDFDFFGVRLNFDFPAGFVLKKSEPQLAAAFSGKVLEIGGLSKKGEGDILISGKITGTERQFFEIKSRLSADYKGEIFEVGGKTAVINIAPSPLALTIALDDSPESVVFLGQSLRYRLNYRNTADIGLTDAVIKMKLAGEMFDFAGLETNGFFDSRTNTIVWNAANTPAFSLIEPGGGGSVEFEIKVKENYPIKRLSDKNFILKADGEISSPTVPYYVSADKTVGLASHSVKVAGYVVLQPFIYFNDPAVKIVNKGTLPPKVNQPINFTVHWVIRNYAADIKDINIKSYLLSGVRFTGFSSSTVGSAPVYNERTQEIIWMIDKIQAAKGIVNKPIEAVFQIEAVPNIIQAGAEMPLMSEVSIRAIDEFTNTELNNKADGLSSRSLMDAGFDQKTGEVSQ